MTSLRLAVLGDRVCLAAFLLTILVEVTGGVRVGQDWYRVSVTSAWRLAFYTIALVVLRHLVVRRPSLRERLIARRRGRSSAGWPGLRLSLPTRRDWLLAVVGLGLLTAWTMREQIVLITGVPDLGDPLFSMWRISTIAHQLRNDPWHLFDGNMFYPAPNTLAYSDAVFLPGLIAAPFLWSGVPVAIVYGSLYVASAFLAGLAMFLLVRTLTHAFAPAFVAAVVFAFYPYRFSGYSHLEKQGTLFMPLALLLLIRLLQARHQREMLLSGALVGLLVALQTLWSIYSGAFLAVSLAAFVFVRWAAGHFQFRERARGLVAAAVVAAAIIVPYTLPYWQARVVVGERDRFEALVYGSRPADLLTVTSWNRMWAPVLSQGYNGERHLFPGATSIALTAVALTPPVSPLAGAAGAALLVSIDGALGLSGSTFTWLYDTIPPFRAFRAPGRFSLVIGLYASLLAGFGLARLLGRRPGRGRRVAAGAIIAFAAVELQPRMPLHPAPTSPPAIYSTLPDRGDAVVVDLPVPDVFNPFDFVYIYNSTFHRRRLLNGSSGFIPPDYYQLVFASRSFPDDESLRWLRARGAEYAVLHGDYYGADAYARVVGALADRPDVTLVAARPSPGGAEDRLYRLTRSATRSSRAILRYPRPAHGGRQAHLQRPAPHQSQTDGTRIGQGHASPRDRH